MSHAIEDSVRLFCIQCADVGLDCNYVIFGNSKEGTMANAIVHMFDYHAIDPEEMTTCMRLKIKENICSLFS